MPFTSLMSAVGAQFYWDLLKIIQNASQNNLPEKIAGDLFTPILQWLRVVHGRVKSSAILGYICSRPKRHKRGPWVRKQKALKLCRVKVDGCQKAFVWTLLELFIISAIEIRSIPWCYDTGHQSLLLQNFKSCALNHDLIFIKLFLGERFHCMCFLLLALYID